MTLVATTDPALQRARAAAVVCTLALIALGLAWELWLAPTGRGTWALKVLPLAFALSGLTRRRAYTYQWLSLAIWLYVTEALVRAVTEPGLARAMAITQCALALLLFGACIAFVRALRAREPVAPAAP